jgi:hypothetical protein
VPAEFAVARFGTRLATGRHGPEAQVPEKKGPKGSGGEGGIRTHVPELPDHPISSRRRYDHFGTSPVNLKSSRLLKFLEH